MAFLRVLLNFTHSSDHVLEETTGHVLAGMFGTATATFPSPPVTKAALQTAAANFTNAIAAQKEGGPAATPALVFQVLCFAFCLRCDFCAPRRFTLMAYCCLSEDHPFPCPLAKTEVLEQSTK